MLKQLRNTNRIQSERLSLRESMQSSDRAEEHVLSGSGGDLQPSVDVLRANERFAVERYGKECLGAG